MIKIFRILLVSLLVFGCNQGRHRQSEVRYFEHMVEYKGETLGLIARWYTGKADNWKILLDHNAGIDVRRMRAGTMVRIPQALLVRQDLLPRSYVEKFYSEHRSEASREASDPSLVPGVGNAPEATLPPMHVDADDGSQDQNSQTQETGPTNDDSRPGPSASPPEETLPEAGGNMNAPSDNNSLDQGASGSADQQDFPQQGASKSRDELLKELLANE